MLDPHSFFGGGTQMFSRSSLPVFGRPTLFTPVRQPGEGRVASDLASCGPLTIKRHRTGTPGGVRPNRDLALGRPVSLAEPGAIVRRHLGALRLRRMAPARGCLLAVLRGGPPQLRAVVRIV